ncbi:hypothetical protein RFI_14200, partial [Reticulomyxa filosa]
MINSIQYMKKKLIIVPYSVCSFHSKNITFDNITINGCVYVIGCTIDGIGKCHITQQLIHTDKSVVHYHFKSPDVAAIYNNLGLVHDSKGEYDKALECYQKDLEIILSKFGLDHPGVATLCNNIKYTYYNKQEYDKTMKFAKEALNWGMKKLDFTHPYIGDSLLRKCIVNFYTKIGKYHNTQNVMLELKKFKIYFGAKLISKNRLNVQLFQKCIAF